MFIGWKQKVDKKWVDEKKCLGWKKFTMKKYIS